MNVVLRRKYSIEFDVWEPLEDRVEKEMDEVVKVIKNTLSHAGNVHVVKVSEERQ